MTCAERVRRQQLIQTAEGYLDLAMVLDDCLPLDLLHRYKLAELSIACLSQVCKPEGHEPYILFLKGQAARLAERYNESIGFLQQSSRLDPDNIHANLALGWCYKRIDRLDLAIETMELAVEIDNDSAIAHYNLACYWALANQPKTAVLHLSHAFSLNPDYRNYVSDEPDFNAIRNDVDFLELTSIPV